MLELLLRFWIGGERLLLHRGEKLVPDQIQHRLHVLHSARDGDHGILLGQDDAELAEGPVAAEGPVPATPELVAVALVPIALGVAAV